MRDRRIHAMSILSKAASAAALAGFALVSFHAPALAFNKRVERACLADYKNLCPQYRVNSPQLRVCMESKANAISWGCIEALIDSGEVDKKRVRR
jgi:hypothetical protein